MKEFSLVDVDGNAMGIISYTINAMRKVGFNPSDIQQYRQKATSGDYSALLCLSMEMINKCNEKLGLS